MLFIAAVMAAALLCGCSEENRYSSIYTTEVETEDLTAPASAMEVDLVEDLSAKREEYVKAIKTLKSYYEQTGNHRKEMWTERELNMLGESPQYTYITAGKAASAELRASETIEAADEMYREADKLYSTARFLAILGDKPKLRQALSMFNELIEKYPTSDKIDDAAYKAGAIYESFGDEKLAATYYQRAFQWDAETPYPARYKAAYLLDNKLGMKSQALNLYKESLEKENLYSKNREHAEDRVKALETSKQTKDAKKELK